MSDLISRSALKKYMRDYKWEFALNSDFSKAIEMVDVQPTIEAVPLSEIYRCIAGHSNYHGDSVLSAMTCITEGKEVKPIKPIEAVPVVEKNKIIDEFAERCKADIMCQTFGLHPINIDKIAEQMKGGTK